MRLASIAGLLGITGCAGSTLRWERTEPADPAPAGPGYLRTYKESHFRELGADFRRGITTPEFLAEVAAARVLFLGDHHADRTLHRRMLEVLEELDRGGLRYHLGLECIGTQDQEVIDRYLAGAIDLDDLVHAVHSRWPETWLHSEAMDGGFYRELLRRARRSATPVFALEPAPRLPLYERDQAIARTVLRRARSQPDALLVVIVGETHLLGHGQLVQRVALPNVAVCANLSVSLRERAARTRFAPQHRVAETTASVMFYLPLDGASVD